MARAPEKPPLEYVLHAVERIYLASKERDPQRPWKYLYQTAEDVARAGSDHTRQYTRREILALWKNMGNGRSWFIRDVEWRKTHGIPITNPKPRWLLRREGLLPSRPIPRLKPKQLHAADARLTHSASVHTPIRHDPSEAEIERRLLAIRLFRKRADTNSGGSG